MELSTGSAEGVLPQRSSVTAHVQPIVRLDDQAVVGYEALARVDGGRAAGPQWWLERAEAAGQRTALELMFLEAAAQLGDPPDGTLLFVNASTSALAQPGVQALRSRLPDRLVIEITEQEAVDDYEVVRSQLQPWTGGGARLAIDDTGAGFSSLRHVVELSPDFLKLDRSLVQGIDLDPTRRALVRALVAFAREAGTSVIAEGVETAGELAALVASEVPLAQGYLLGQPAAAWQGAQTSMFPVDDRLDRYGDLRVALSRARTVASACDAVTAELFGMGHVMPSLYLERGGRLRCMAQRGVWQVIDGLDADAGITGHVWATGLPYVATSVADDPRYVEAVPGVVAEVCVPISVGGAVVGALNLDSLCPLPDGTLRRLQELASLLERRLTTLGWHDDPPWHGIGSASLQISALAADVEAPEKILSAIRTALGMDSAALVRPGDGVLALGPLAACLRSATADQLAALCRLVDKLSSCYTGHETTGLALVGSEVLRSAGARALLLLPLRANGDRVGTVVLANSRPAALDPTQVERLEALAGQAAAVLSSVGLIVELRRQAHQDGLTRLGNRMAFEVALDRAGSSASVVLADIDLFKAVNDRHGHLGGDEALRSLSAGVADACPSVQLYRFGGDEIVGLLPTDEPAAALRLAQRMCAAAADALAPWGTAATIGLATAGTDEPARAVLARADRALLEGKAGARGRVTVDGVQLRGGRRPVARC